MERRIIMKHSAEFLREKAFEYRKRFLEIFTTLGFGHVTSAFSWAEIATVLYHEILELPPDYSVASEADKVVVSKGHGAGMLFPVFEGTGLLRPGELEELVRIGGEKERIKKLFYPGFDFYGGSLGIGINLAAGLAKGAKLSGKPWNVFCIVGDAECYEGSVWEAILFAGHQQLDNLIVVVDRNMLACSDFTEKILKLEPFREKWEAFGWSVAEVDGHDVEDVYEALAQAVSGTEKKPHCIIANTKKGQGLDYLIDKPLMHGYMPKGEDIERAFRELNRE